MEITLGILGEKVICDLSGDQMLLTLEEAEFQNLI